MTIEFLEYENHPFAFDREPWETFSMAGFSRDKWRKVENSDSVFRILQGSSEISEFEAKALAEAHSLKGPKKNSSNNIQLCPAPPVVRCLAHPRRLRG